MKFQRKPIIVDAEMFPELGDLASCGKFYQWLTDNKAWWRELKFGNIQIHGDPEHAYAEPGDWVILHANGDWSVMGPIEFWHLYEWVPSERQEN